MSDYPRDQRNRGNGDNSGIPWPLIIIAFCIFWPVGILLLLLKFSQDAKLQQHKEDWVNALNNQDIPFAQRQETAAQRQAERQQHRTQFLLHRLWLLSVPSLIVVPGLDNGTAPQNYVPIIEHHRLPWRHCPHRRVKAHQQLILPSLFHRTGRL